MMNHIDPRWQAARHILAVRLDNLGDVLVTTPAIHAIKTSLPDADITLLTSPVGAQVGRLNPDISEVIAYEAPWVDPWQTLPQDSQREQQMIALLRERRFDAAVIFTSYRQSSLPAAYLCYLADIPLRLAVSVDGSGSLLTTRCKPSERLMHEVESGLALVGAVGLTTDCTDLVLRVPEQARKTLRAKLDVMPGAFTLAQQRPFIVIHPGCSMPARTYPWEQYARVAERLVENFDAVVAFTGTATEQELVARIQAEMHPSLRSATLSFAGALTFPELCALIEQVDLTITNNTGPMHIAAAVKTPVVALFALTNPPEQWGPWHVPHRQLYHEVACRLCYCRRCPFGHECLALVSPEMVLQAARELLAETGSLSQTSEQQFTECEKCEEMAKTGRS